MLVKVFMLSRDILLRKLITNFTLICKYLNEEYAPARSTRVRLQIQSSHQIRLQSFIFIFNFVLSMLYILHGIKSSVLVINIKSDVVKKHHQMHANCCSKTL